MGGQIIGIIIKDKNFAKGIELEECEKKDGSLIIRYQRPTDVGLLKQIKRFFTDIHKGVTKAQDTLYNLEGKSLPMTIHVKGRDLKIKRDIVNVINGKMALVEEDQPQNPAKQSSAPGKNGLQPIPAPPPAPPPPPPLATPPRLTPKPTSKGSANAPSPLQKTVPSSLNGGEVANKPVNAQLKALIENGVKLRPTNGTSAANAKPKDNLTSELSDKMAERRKALEKNEKEASQENWDEQ